MPYGFGDEFIDYQPRVLVWFSCGSASAVAAKLAKEKYRERCEVLYCDTLAYEHPDNLRFLRDVEMWLGEPIKILRSPTYTDIFDVFRKTRWLVGPAGARCTTELKKNIRTAYQRPDDIHIFGYTADEAHRVKNLKAQNPELYVEFPLIDQGFTKADCHRVIAETRIETPAMYRMGYEHNNCIGCVKGQTGYWQRIRVDFPDAFDRMAKMERELDAAICKTETTVNGERIRQRVFLDELPLVSVQGVLTMEPDLEMDCGVLCSTALISR